MIRRAESLAYGKARPFEAPSGPLLSPSTKNPQCPEGRKQKRRGLWNSGGIAVGHGQHVDLQLWDLPTGSVGDVRGHEGVQRVAGIAKMTDIGKGGHLGVQPPLVKNGIATVIGDERFPRVKFIHRAVVVDVEAGEAKSVSQFVASHAQEIPRNEGLIRAVVSRSGIPPAIVGETGIQLVGIEVDDMGGVFPRKAVNSHRGGAWTLPLAQIAARAGIGEVESDVDVVFDSRIDGLKNGRPLGNGLLDHPSADGVPSFSPAIEVGGIDCEFGSSRHPTEGPERKGSVKSGERPEW